MDFFNNNNKDKLNQNSSSNYLFEQFKYLICRLIRLDLSEAYDFENILKIIKHKGLESRLTNPACMKSILIKFSKIKVISIEEMNKEILAFLEKYQIEEKSLEYCKLKVEIEITENCHIPEQLEEIIKECNSQNLEAKDTNDQNIKNTSKYYILNYLKDKSKEMDNDIEALKIERDNVKKSK